MARTKSLPVPIPMHTHFDAVIARKSNTIGVKIRQARLSMNYTQANFSEALKFYGVSVQTPAVNKWEKGETVPNAYQLAAICHTLHIKNGYDFFFGNMDDPPAELNAEGQRKLLSYKKDLIASGLYSPSKAPVIISKREMPYSLLPASAGTGEDLDWNQFEMREFPEESIPNGADFAIRVHGDSMEPVYTEGQTAWIQKCRSLRNGEVGLFIVDGEGFIKIYEERMPEEDQRESYTDSYGVVHAQVLLLSYNSTCYPPKVITPDMSFMIAGRVLN